MDPNNLKELGVINLPIKGIKKPPGGDPGGGGGSKDCAWYIDADCTGPFDEFHCDQINAIDVE